MMMPNEKRNLKTSQKIPNVVSSKVFKKQDDWWDNLFSNPTLTLTLTITLAIVLTPTMNISLSLTLTLTLTLIIRWCNHKERLKIKIDERLTFDELCGGRLAATAHMRCVLAVNKLARV